jgi:hypothetical protein
MRTMPQYSVSLLPRKEHFTLDMFFKIWFVLLIQFMWASKLSW